MTSQDEKAADALTKVLIVTIAGPAIVIGLGYVITKPIWLILAAFGFRPVEHPWIAIPIQILLFIAWIGGSWIVIRFMWPRKKAKTTE